MGAPDESAEEDTLTDVSLPGVSLLAKPKPPPGLEISSSGPSLPNHRSTLCDPRAHRTLAQQLLERGQVDRAHTLREVAEALEGKLKEAPAPRMFLTAAGRQELRHSSVQREGAELLSLCGEALVEVLGTEKSLPEAVPLDQSQGPGVERVGQALCFAARVLGMQAPLPWVVDSNRPPFFIALTRSRLMVSRVAVESELSDGELRFFAGRALFSLCPDLLALRLLGRSQLKEGLVLVEEALSDTPEKSLEAKAARRRLRKEALPRLRELLSRAARQISWGELMDGARHTANRAGLLAAGGIGPAISALRHKHAREDELEELVAFAGGESYLSLRRPPQL